MKRLSSSALSAGAILVLLSVTPAFAQVAGNPGDLHTQTLYMKQYNSLHGPPTRIAGSSTTLTPAHRISGTSRSARSSPSIEWDRPPICAPPPPGGANFQNKTRPIRSDRAQVTLALPPQEHPDLFRPPRARTPAICRQAPDLLF
jgi:hypothetical protein